MKGSSTRLVILTCLNGHTFGVPEDVARESLCPICHAEPPRADVQSPPPRMLTPGPAILAATGIFLAMGVLVQSSPAGIYVLLAVATCMTYYLHRARRQSAHRPPRASRAALEKTIQFFHTVCAICLMLSIVQSWVNHSAGRLDEASTKARLRAVRELFASWHGFLMDSKLALIITCVLLLVLLTCAFLPAVHRWASKAFLSFKLITDILVHAFVAVSMFGVGVTQVGSALAQGIADVDARSGAIDEAYYRIGDAIERALMQGIAKAIYLEASPSCTDAADEAGGACATTQEALKEQVTLLGKLDTISSFEGKLDAGFRDDIVHATAHLHHAAASSGPRGNARTAQGGAPDASSMSTVQARETVLNEGQANAIWQRAPESTDEAFAEAVSESLKVAGDGGLKTLLAPFIANSPFFEVLLHLADETVIAAVREKAADILLRVSQDPRLDLRALIKAGAAAISRSKGVQRVREEMNRSARALNRETNALLSRLKADADRRSQRDAGPTPTAPGGPEPGRDSAGRDPLVPCQCRNMSTGKVEKAWITPSSRCIPRTMLAACPVITGTEEPAAAPDTP
jgi:hypothetical protein